jgi:MFS family permease
MARPTFAERLRAPSLAFADYRYFWLANVAWNVGRTMEQVLVGWIAFQLTGSAFLVALLGFYRMLPLFILGMFGGVLGDRYDRKRLVLALQATNVACVSVLAVLSFAGSLDFLQLSAAELVLGTSMAFDWPSRRALTVDLVDRKHLANAVALDSSGMNLSRAIGPLFGGALLAAFGGGISFAALAATYLLNGLLVLAIRSRTSGKTSVRTQGVLSILTAGVGYVLRDEAIVGVLAITVVMNLFLFSYQQILPAIAADALRTDSFGFGLVSSADGIGSLAGTLLIGAMVGAKRNGQLFWLGSLVGSIALVGFALARTVELGVLLMAVGGLTRSGFSTFQSTIVLRNASDEMRGRAMGVLTLAIGVGPFGSLEIGALAESVGPSPAVAINAALSCILVAAAAARWPGLRNA